MPEEYTRFASAWNKYRELSELVHRDKSGKIDSDRFVVEIEKKSRIEKNFAEHIEKVSLQ